MRFVYFLFNVLRQLCPVSMFLYFSEQTIEGDVHPFFHCVVSDFVCDQGWYLSVMYSMPDVIIAVCIVYSNIINKG